VTTLLEAITAKGLPSECIVTPFDALYRGHLVRVTAVLKNTAVFEDDQPFMRHLALQESFEVGELEWREQSEATQKLLESSTRGRKNAKENTRRRIKGGWRNRRTA